MDKFVQILTLESILNQYRVTRSYIDYIKNVMKLIVLNIDYDMKKLYYIKNIQYV